MCQRTQLRLFFFWSVLDSAPASQGSLQLPGTPGIWRSVENGRVLPPGWAVHPQEGRMEGRVTEDLAGR